MLEMLTRYFAHDHWANERVLTVLTQDANPAALRLFAHILAAQRVWMLRLRREDANTPIWPDLSVEECHSLQQRNVEAYTETLSRLTSDGLVHTVTYRNSKGATFQTPVGEVLMHVFSHGVYHRGQIALVLRQAGAEPVNTDYITFVRETSSFRH
jgi:uncharacterized damage-inducible protein DinB